MLAAALLLSACSNDSGESGNQSAPEELAFAAPTEVLDALRQDEWGPSPWDLPGEPFFSETSGLGAFVMYESGAIETPWLGALHTGDGWQTFDPADHIDIKEGEHVAGFLGPHSLILFYDGGVYETADGINFSTVIERGPTIPGSARWTFAQDEDTFIFSAFDGAEVLGDWHSTEVGEWNLADTSHFEGLAELERFPGDFPTQHLGNNGQRLFQTSAASVLFHDGTTWHEAWPFDSEVGGDRVNSFSELFWSHKLERWVAVVRKHDEFEISESADGIEWQQRTVNAPEVGAHWTEVIGGRLFLGNDGVSTTDFDTWDIYNPGSATLRPLNPLGDGQCIATQYERGSEEQGIVYQLMAGPCPYSGAAPGTALVPTVQSVAADLSTDSTSWDGKVETAWTGLERRHNTLPVFGLLANLACQGIVTEESSGSVARATRSEVNAALGLATAANCAQLDALSTLEPLRVDADSWDDMIDQRFGSITHQHMSRYAFDAAAAFECEREANVFEVIASPRYNRAEAAHITSILQLDCDLVSSREATEWDGTLLVASNTVEGSDLFAFSAENGNVDTRQLTANPGHDHRGSFSSDGDAVVFTTDDGSGEDIALVGVDGGPVTLLTSDADYDGRPSLSPDGSRIVFENETERAGNISIMDADGSNRSVIADGTSGYFALGNRGYDSAWSPDGTKVAFYGGESNDIWVHDLETGTNRSLTEDVNGDADDFSWSPDSSHLVFIGRGKEFLDGDDLWLVDVNSSDSAHRLAELAGNQTDPRWSPDGRRIAFVTDRDAEYPRASQLFILDRDDGSVTQLTNDPDGAEWPVWSPDGSAVAYARNVPSEAFTPDVSATVAVVDLSGRVTLTGEPGVPLDWAE